MSTQTEKSWFDEIETIVADDFRFKAKLRIGGDAFSTNRWKKKARELWEAAGMAGTAAVVVKSAPVASYFFAPTGVLSFLGIGTAVTPVGWVVTSMLLAGIGWISITRYLREKFGDGTIVVPKFINTPIDVLALALFDLMAPLALKLAAADGHIDPTEREVIIRYFEEEWGFDNEFIREGLDYTEARLPAFSIHDLAATLAEHKLRNKDCNYKEMSREFIDFLIEIVEADGRITPAEQKLVEDVKRIFGERGQTLYQSLKNGVTQSVDSTARTVINVHNETCNSVAKSANRLIGHIRGERPQSTSAKKS